MKTDPVAASDLAASVISVPPLARDANGAPTREENRKVVTWLRQGGVTTYLYGGNANFYHVGLAEFPELLGLLADICPPDGWMIPSIGPDFGKALDQVAVLRSFPFPTAMALPMASVTRPAGIATGLRRLADRYGKPLIAYIRAEGYVAPKDVAALFADGVLCAVKYAIERADPAEDRALADLVAAAGTERLVSGIGERPAIVHLTKFGLAGFTSGSVSIAPHLSSAILAAIRAGDLGTAERLRATFLPFEDQRDAHSPILVLHHGVEAAGIARTGPLQPYLSGLDTAAAGPVAAAARALYEANAAFAAREAA